MPKQIIFIGRATILTLWAAVVAERLGFDHEEALTLGQALASKSRSLLTCRSTLGGMFHVVRRDALPADQRH